MESTIQDLHDLAVRNGAECSGKALFAQHRPQTLQFLTPETLANIQRVHDFLGGIDNHVCDTYQTKQANGLYFSAAPDTVVLTCDDVREIVEIVAHMTEDLNVQMARHEHRDEGSGRFAPKPSDGAMTPERRAFLMGCTDVGHSILIDEERDRRTYRTKQTG